MDEVLLKPRSLIKVYFVNSQASARMYGNISVYFSLCIGMRQGCTLRQIVTSSSMFKHHLSSILDRYCVRVCVCVAYSRGVSYKNTFRQKAAYLGEDVSSMKTWTVSVLLAATRNLLSKEKESEQMEAHLR